MIVDAEAEHEADPIAMGTHGHRGAGLWLLGSVAESNIPVLALRDVTPDDADEALASGSQVSSVDKKLALGNFAPISVRALANERLRPVSGAFHLMRHDHRNCHRFDRRSSHATEHPFERPCVTVGTEHQQVGVHSACLAQERRAGVRA